MNKQLGGYAILAYSFGLALSGEVHMQFVKGNPTETQFATYPGARAKRREVALGRARIEPGRIHAWLSSWPSRGQHRMRVLLLHELVLLNTCIMLWATVLMHNTVIILITMRMIMSMTSPWTTLLKLQGLLESQKRHPRRTHEVVSRISMSCDT
jgi:hypothetical protein